MKHLLCDNKKANANKNSKTVKEKQKAINIPWHLQSQRADT